MSFGFGALPLGPAINPPAAAFQGNTAPGYTPNVEFQLDPVDPGIGTANRDKILAEQQRILTIFNDWFIAQKLKLLGQNNARLPQIANESGNRDQLQAMIKDMAEMNINRVAMTGLINNFGQQYCKFVTDRDAVESQRQLNEIEKARMLGYTYLPPAAQRFVRISQVAVILSVGGTFGTLIAIWSGATAIKTSMQAAKTAGLQCLVMGLLQFTCLCARIIVRFDVKKLMIPIPAYGRDGTYITRVWDIYITVVLSGIISFGAWMWTKSNKVFGDDDGSGVSLLQAFPTAAATAASVAPYLVKDVVRPTVTQAINDFATAVAEQATHVADAAAGRLVPTN